ncbi:uncharacterized protein SPSC_02283 [Sporisorium scitamineum]|uniref:Transcription factor domain-containing protein n=1 Tax=Sporisorium scitamineum TaxID=49012 RepID=A0A0F7RYY0_9BASI|nr:hypothetical protein [Sporisorium scitamineum]CDU23654.1 uncharacterized protein SPSC_02283 [Sporisorium scitamineum]
MAPAATASASRAPEVSSSRSGDDRHDDLPTSPRSPTSRASRASPSSHLYRRTHRYSAHESSHRRPSKGDLLPHHQRGATLRPSPEPPTLLSFASSFQTLIDAQAPVSSTHSAYSELLSVSHSAFPPSTLPISALTDLISSSATSSVLSSSKSSFSSVSTSLIDGNANSMGGVGTATTAGLDLLGILAEEVDWDPQHKGASGAAQLALLGQSLQSHHEAKQKLWAGHILGSLGLFSPSASRRNSFSTLNASEPPAKAYSRLPANYASQASEQTSRAHPRKAASLVDDPLNTMTLTKRTALFYENLYEHLCPGIVPRAYIYPKLGRKSHDQDPSFAALALSISLLGLLGLTLPKPSSSSSKSHADESSIDAQLQRPFVMPCVPPERRSKAQESGQLRLQAAQLIEKILLLRLSASGGGVSFGQAPTLETVLTSFFLSLAMYNLDDAAHQGGMPSFTEWKDASFFRFCETITLAKILGLDQVGHAAATSGTVSEEAMVWSMLVRAERWWAEQKLGYVCQMDIAASLTASERGGGGSRKRVKSDEDSTNTMPSKRARATQPMEFLVKLGFASVRDHLLYRFRDLIDCWSHNCSPSCQRLTSDTAVRIHDSLASLGLSSNANLAANPILIDLARQALRAKLWIACLNHNLVSVHAQGPLRPDQPLHIALDTLDLLEDLDQLVLRPLPSDAALGDAIQEALQAIRLCVGKLPEGQFAAEMFSFEQVEASDESDSPGASPRAEDGGAARSNSTTITRAAQSVMDNLDRFLNRVVS